MKEKVGAFLLIAVILVVGGGLARALDGDDDTFPDPLQPVWDAAGEAWGAMARARRGREIANRQEQCREREAEDLGRDWATLNGIYHAMGGPEWTSAENWLSEAPSSAWHGVKVGGCAGHLPVGGVVSLNLAENNLTGELPAELGNLIHLVELNLSHNNLTGEIPPELANLQEFLEELNLSHNDMTGEIPPELSDLDNLLRVDLSHNRLSGRIPSGLTLRYSGGTLERKHIFLNDNQLTGPLPASFGQIDNLDSIRLGGTNRLSGCLPDTYLRLGSGYGLPDNDLDDLRLPRCQVVEEAALTALYNATDGPNWTDDSNWLEKDPFGRGRDHDDPFSWWHGVTTDHNTGVVTGLWLPDNGLKGRLPPELGDLVFLERLRLSGNQLTGEIPPELGNLTNLETLNLSSNNFTGEIPPELGNLPESTSLFLSENPQLTGCIPEGVDAYVEHLEPC